jgi:formylmethanofuran dehydrogenase subunit B
MKKIAFFGIVIMGLIVIGSCVKKEDTIAKIEIRDENNDVVEQAMVVLHGTSTCNCPSQVAVWDTAYTNAAGIAIFNYNEIYQLGQAGVAVLDINAYKANRFGQGIIKIEAEMINEETVIIQP